MERVWSEAEIAAFKAAEPQLAALGMYVDGPKGDQNGKQFMRWFDLNPQEPVTVEKLLWLFEEFKKQSNGIFFKSDAQMKFEKAAAHLAPADLDTLERFLKSNRLWPDDDGAYSNAVQFIGVMGGRSYTNDVLMHWALPYLQGTSREPLRWKSAGRDPNPKYGQHSGGDRHFMPRNEVNRPALPSHSSNPRLNGQLEREQRERDRQRFNQPPDDPMAAHNWVWAQEIKKAVAEGRTHTERARIAQAAQQTPGGPRLQAEAAQREAALIRQDRERSR